MTNLSSRTFLYVTQALTSAEEKEGDPLQFTVTQRTGKGSELELVAYALSFSVVSLFLIVQINPFRLSQSQFATESQPLGFSGEFFYRSSLAGWGPIFFFVGT
jgi:hypothetical protein